MTKEDIDRIASEYFDDKESEHEMEEVFDLAEKALEEQKEEKWVSVTEAWMMEDLENQIKEGKGCLGRDEE